VLSGPIVRHVSDRTVTVWLALKQRETLTLNVYDTADAAGLPIATGKLDTVTVGAHLHLAAVTATLVPPHPGLSGGITYYYDITLGNGWCLADLGVVSKLDHPDADVARATRAAVLAFGTDARPSFALPPADLTQVHILHGSCRKLHGEQHDGLAAAHYLIRDAYRPDESWGLRRPHVLVCTGDQIYADDVADCVLAMCTDFGDTLLDWKPKELLPGLSPPRSPIDLPPGTRSQPVTEVGGFTGSLVDTPEVAKSHLMGLGEFLAMYLLAWSPVLWPETLPTSGASYDGEERENVERLRATLVQVRRALANVIVYMSFDDHEVTDDWNLNREWCRRVWGEVGDTTHGEPKALGRRVITNALIAYSLFQMWGNTPDRFTGGGPGAQIMALLAQWNGQPDRQPVLDEIATLLGVPGKKLPTFKDGPAQLPRDSQALGYAYCITWPKCPIELVVTDPRTSRVFYPEPMEPAGVMSDAAIVEQIPVPDPVPYLSLVVIPGPVLGVPWIEARQESRTPDIVWGRDAEAWGLQPRTFHRLLGRLARRPRVLVLSGDVHYGFTITAGLWASQPYGEPTPLATPARGALAQLNSSSLRNETSSTRTIHGMGWNAAAVVDAALVHNPDDWAGWPDLRGLGGTAYVPRSGARTEQVGRLIRFPAVLNVTDVKQRPHMYAPEHWRYRLTYLTGVREVPATVTPVARPPAGASKEAAAGWGFEAGTGLTELVVGNDGTEVVGWNNLGEIRFGEGASPEAPALPVLHVLWWSITASGRPEYSTTFRFTLDPTDTSAIPGQVWEQRP
jgi:hypothetical protein